MPTHLTSGTNNQDGFTLAGAWNESLLTLGGNTNRNIGMRFQIFSGSFDSESRPLDPVRIYSPFTLTLYISSISTNTGATLFFVPEAAPEAYSTALLPFTRGDAPGGDGVFLDSSEVAVADRAQTILGTAAAGTAVTWEDLDIYSLLPHTHTSAWNGYICLTIHLSTAGTAVFHSSRTATSAYVPTLTTNEVAFHTGVTDGSAFGRRARSRLCPRTGVPVSSDEMIRDGYKEGLKVSPEAWDPEEPEDRYVPSPFEGVVDDED